MISQDKVLEVLSGLISSSKTKISQIIIKEDIISFSVFDNAGFEEAQTFKKMAENILFQRFPEFKILISITNLQESQKQKITGIEKIILVSSGKGGVGKSTISAYLAKYLTEKGKRVGLLDADIYGPSIAEILALQDFLPEIKNNKLLPAETCGIKVMSMAFLAKGEGAFAWRGPMITKAVNQLFTGVEWGQLDYLIVDTPPGTGDLHLSIMATYQIDGVFIVTMPSKVSSIDVARSIDLCQKFSTPIYGIIENMSYYQDQKNQIFGHGAGQYLSEKFNIPLIDKIALIPGISNISFEEITRHMKINLSNTKL
jgi:ATP-binding protein involved in chromosome partitioning